MVFCFTLKLALQSAAKGPRAQELLFSNHRSENALFRVREYSGCAVMDHRIFEGPPSRCHLWGISRMVCTLMHSRSAGSTNRLHAFIARRRRPNRFSLAGATHLYRLTAARRAVEVRDFRYRQRAESEFLAGQRISRTLARRSARLSILSLRSSFPSRQCTFVPSKCVQSSGWSTDSHR
jgi:hypothetical protein